VSLRWVLAGLQGERAGRNRIGGFLDIERSRLGEVFKVPSGSKGIPDQLGEPKTKGFNNRVGGKKP